MEMLLKFLIYSLKTLNGVRESALQLLNFMNTQSIEKFKKQTGMAIVNKIKEKSLTDINSYEIFEKVMLKYKVLKIRGKISFMAF